MSGFRAATTRHLSRWSKFPPLGFAIMGPQPPRSQWRWVKVEEDKVGAEAWQTLEGAGGLLPRTFRGRSIIGTPIEDIPEEYFTPKLLCPQPVIAVRVGQHALVTPFPLDKRPCVKHENRELAGAILHLGPNPVKVAFGERVGGRFRPAPENIAISLANDDDVPPWLPVYVSPIPESLTMRLPKLLSRDVPE